MGKIENYMDYLENEVITLKRELYLAINDYNILYEKYSNLKEERSREIDRKFKESSNLLGDILNNMVANIIDKGDK